MPKTRVLVLDGGGLRGILPCTILDWMETTTGRPIGSLFDLIVGVSTGGLLALALSKEQPLTAKQCIDLYLQRGKDIFSRGLGREIESVGGLLGPKYSADGLEKVLADTFGDAWLLQKDGPKAAVVAFETTQNLVHVLEPAPDWPLAALARATSAAPTYFPPYHKAPLAPSERQPECFVDGGVATNTPELLALALAHGHFGVRPEECLVMSLGTGQYNSPIDWSSAKGWGIAQWAPHLADLFMTGAGGAEQAAMQVLAPHYVRLQPILTPELVAMDNAEPAHLQKLVSLGTTYTHEQAAVLDGWCKRLLARE